MKLIEVCFKFDQPLPEWQDKLLMLNKAWHVETNEAPGLCWIIFRVEDDWTEPAETPVTLGATRGDC